MGNQCNAEPQRADVQYDSVPIYSVLEPSSKDLPRLGLRGQGPSSVISLGQMGHGRSMKKKSSLLPRAKYQKFGFDEEDVLYPVPVPTDNTPPAKSFELTEPDYPQFFPVSSYAVCDAPLRKKSRHVQFANSPTHSVHRSEFGVEPYSEIYGMHPRTFDFDEFGNKAPRAATHSTNRFLPREAAYCHWSSPPSELEAHNPPLTGASAYRSSESAYRNSAYRNSVACNIDEGMYSTHVEWGDW